MSTRAVTPRRPSAQPQASVPPTELVRPPVRLRETGALCCPRRASHGADTAAAPPADAALGFDAQMAQALAASLSPRGAHAAPAPDDDLARAPATGRRRYAFCVAVLRLGFVIGQPVVGFAIAMSSPMSTRHRSSMAAMGWGAVCVCAIPCPSTASRSATNANAHPCSWPGLCLTVAPRAPSRRPQACGIPCGPREAGLQGGAAGSAYCCKGRGLPLARVRPGLVSMSFASCRLVSQDQRSLARSRRRWGEACRWGVRRRRFRCRCRVLASASPTRAPHRSRTRGWCQQRLRCCIVASTRRVRRGFRALGCLQARHP